MKKIVRIAVILSLATLLAASASPALAASAYKVPTANPSFNYGSRVSGSYLDVQVSDNSYMRVREGRIWFIFIFITILDATWGSWQPFTEASRQSILDIEVELEGYQSDSGESWYVQFYDYNAAAWDSTFYALGSLPTSPKGNLRVAVGDAARARSFVSPSGAFQLKMTSTWDLTRTDLYIDLFRARIIYDDVAPVSEITAPADGEYTKGASYTIAGTSYDHVPDASGVTAVDVSVDGGANWSPAVPVAPGDYSTWSYEWDPIPGEGTYSILSRAADEAGNVETPGPGVALVVDWTPPEVESTSPADGAYPVAVTSVITATFEEANGMDAGTINTDTYSVVNEVGEEVDGSVSYDPATKTATFEPEEDLEYEEIYTATLTTGIADLAGNPLAEDYTWTFETAPIPPDYIYADDPLWETDGIWRLERYSLFMPGAADILVINIAGDTASYTIPAGYTRLQLASAKYWSCGDVEILLDGAPVDTVALNSQTPHMWGQVIYTNLELDPSKESTLTIRATGTGGPVDGDGKPITYTYEGQAIPLAFVNVQWLKYW